MPQQVDLRQLFPDAFTEEDEKQKAKDAPYKDPGALWKGGAALTRLLSSILSAEGAWPGAAISGAGESAAEWMEGTPQNPARIGVEAGLGAIPVAKLIKFGKPAASALKNAVMVEAGNLGRRWSTSNKTGLGAVGDMVPDLTTPEGRKEAAFDVATTGVGALTGAALSKTKFGNKAFENHNVPPNAPAPPPPITSVAGLRQALEAQGHYLDDDQVKTLVKELPNVPKRAKGMDATPENETLHDVVAEYDKLQKTKGGLSFAERQERIAKQHYLDILDRPNTTWTPLEAETIRAEVDKFPDGVVAKKLGVKPGQNTVAAAAQAEQKGAELVQKESEAAQKARLQAEERQKKADLDVEKARQKNIVDLRKDLEAKEKAKLAAWNQEAANLNKGDKFVEDAHKENTKLNQDEAARQAAEDAQVGLVKQPPTVGESQTFIDPVTGKRTTTSTRYAPKDVEEGDLGTGGAGEVPDKPLPPQYYYSGTGEPRLEYADKDMARRAARHFQAADVVPTKDGLWRVVLGQRKPPAPMPVSPTPEPPAPPTPPPTAPKPAGPKPAPTPAAPAAAAPSTTGAKVNGLPIGGRVRQLIGTGMPENVAIEQATTEFKARQGAAPAPKPAAAPVEPPTAPPAAAAAGAEDDVFARLESLDPESRKAAVAAMKRGEDPFAAQTPAPKPPPPAKTLEPEDPVIQAMINANGPDAPLPKIVPTGHGTMPAEPPAPPVRPPEPPPAPPAPVPVAPKPKGPGPTPATASPKPKGEFSQAAADAEAALKAEAESRPARDPLKTAAQRAAEIKAAKRKAAEAQKRYAPTARPVPEGAKPAGEPTVVKPTDAQPVAPAPEDAKVAPPAKEAAKVASDVNEVDLSGVANGREVQNRIENILEGELHKLAKLSEADDLAGLEAARKGKITIKVPADGTFMILRNEDAIGEFLTRLKKGVKEYNPKKPITKGPQYKKGERVTTPDELFSDVVKNQGVEPAPPKSSVPQPAPKPVKGKKGAAKVAPKTVPPTTPDAAAAFEREALRQEAQGAAPEVVAAVREHKTVGHPGGKFGPPAPKAEGPKTSGLAVYKSPLEAAKAANEVAKANKVTDNPLAGRQTAVATQHEARRAGIPVLGPKGTPMGNEKTLGKFMDKEISPKVAQSLDRPYVRNPESGQISPELAVLLGRIGGGTLGAGIGYGSADEGNRGSAALVGGLAGAAAPSLIQSMAAKGGAAKAPADVKDMISAVTERAPNYFRAGLLSHPLNLMYNSFVGPYGSGLLAGLERTAAGQKGGPQLLKEMNPISWLAKYGRNYKAAAEKIGELERADYSKIRNPNIIDQIAEVPATTMTAGDMATREAVAKAGLPEEVGRQITLTNEPGRISGHFKDIGNYGKGKGPSGSPSIYSKMTLPFRRTTANIMESALERTPGVGELTELFRKVHVPSQSQPFRARAAQQGLGFGVFMAAMKAGENTSSETDKQFKIHNLVSNAGGQYAGIAAAGFAVGQMRRAGKLGPIVDMKSLKDTIAAALQHGIQDVPLPTTRVPIDAVKILKSDTPWEDFQKSEFNPGVVKIIMEQIKKLQSSEE